MIRTDSISSPEIPTQKEARSSKKSNPRRAESIKPLLYEIGSPAPHREPEETIARNCGQETREETLDEILKIMHECGLSESKQRMDDLMDCIFGTVFGTRRIKRHRKSSQSRWEVCNIAEYHQSGHVRLQISAKSGRKINSNPLHRRKSRIQYTRRWREAAFKRT